MSVDFIVIACLSVSGISSILAFSRSIRKDALTTLLSRLRQTTALAAILGVDILVALLAAAGGLVAARVAAKLSISGILVSSGVVLERITMTFMFALAASNTVFTLRAVLGEKKNISEEKNEGGVVRR
jgi:hypothetical protein